ncbi:fungal-specific transcription factor domain-containing protein [Dichotomopilus funicola]|uniref:Fungal-specific transcription factor domain-containing protein n=1 Tax=Dichotomopilus funicola TaxID=1934379 RepID=A0AAN6V3N6_9PEZI|nr:fungal-specific transcription factor domain-containing protein [Dichotomopilus funicola]
MEAEHGQLKRLRRATAACRFCRFRKIKCNAEKPTCSNCKTYGKECVYVQRKPRSSTASTRPRATTPISVGSPLAVDEDQVHQHDVSASGIDRPAQASTEARQVVAQSRPAGFSQTSHSVAATTSGIDGQNGFIRTPPNPAGPGPTAAAAAAIGSYSTSSGPLRTNYHGPTSAHFQEPAGTRGGGGGAPARIVPPELVEKVLMAEAAHQLQMEAINYDAGKLDFDGVEPELGRHLLSLHWNRQHHSFLLTYRPAFMRDMACGGKYFSKLLLNAIYYGASKFSPRLEVRRDKNDVRTAGWRFRLRVKELLGEALDRPEITTIQALLIMTNSLFALSDERSAAWLYAGIAFRMIVDLGIHVDRPVAPSGFVNGNYGLSEEDVEIHRRVFWGAFVVDKIQSLYQGRPPSLQDHHTHVPVLFNDKFEELEHWKPFAYNDYAGNYPGSPAYSVSTFSELCRLCVIMNRIINKVYAEKSARKGSAKLCAARETLGKQLEEWREGLPKHLVYSSISKGKKAVPPPHVISLQKAMYNVLLILLNRPFVSEGHLYSDSPAVVAEAFAACATAATRIVNLLRVYDHTFSIKSAPYLVSYATYVSATILVRIAAQRKNPRSDAHTNLRTCLSVLEKNQETNWAVRKARKVIIDLADRMSVSVELIGRETSVEAVAEAVGEGSGSVRAAGGPLQFSSPPPIRNTRSTGLYRTWDRADSSSQDDGSTTILTHEEPASMEPSGERNGLPDIDLDAIIQSFMQDQQTEQGGGGTSSGTAGTTYMTERVVNMSPNGQFFQAGGGVRAMQPHRQQQQQQQQQSYSNVPMPFLRHEQGVNGWATGSLLTDDLLPEDALFGFNRAGWDDNWWNN